MPILKARREKAQLWKNEEGTESQSSEWVGAETEWSTRVLEKRYIL